MSQNAEVPKQVWSVQGSKFFEHMDDEVPGYGKNVQIMYSLHHQKDFVQTGSDRKIQSCAHLFQDATVAQGSSTSSSSAAELPARRLDLPASPKRGSLAEMTESPMRRAFSKLTNKLTVGSSRLQYAESIVESVRPLGGEQNPHAQISRARKWSFSYVSSGKQFKTGSKGSGV